MNETYWCRACGDETGMAGRCPSCGEELAALPFPKLADDGDAVGFELVDWAAPERADLVAWLVASRIPHRLEGDAVYVDPADENRTDGIIDWVTSPERPSNERVPIEQLRSALVALRRSGKSLEQDPGLIANPELLDEVRDVLDLGVPSGWPIEAWYELRLLTDRLVNEGDDAPDALLVHWARRVAWLIRIYGDGAGARSRSLGGLAGAPAVGLAGGPAGAPSAPAVGDRPSLPDGVAADPTVAPEGLLSWCPNCLFDGVSVVDHCPRCGRPLIKSTVPFLPEADPDDEDVLEVEYRLDDWEHDQRDRLIAMLFEYAVPHRFEEEDSLIVGGGSESLVDTLIEDAVAPPEPTLAASSGGSLDSLGGLGGLGGGGMPAEPDAADALGRLLDASRTVARTPSAAEGPEFTQAALDVLTMNTPFGVDRDQWEQAAQLTHTMLHGDPADAAGTANRAASLVRLLTPWVSATVELPERKEHEQDELVYELGDWPEEKRGELTLALEREAITYSWENDTDLIIDGRDEGRIDTLLDEAEGPEEPVDSADQGDAEDGYQAISNLFGVCDRLAHRPSDKDLRDEAVSAGEAVTGLSVPYGVADSDWWQLRTRARELATELADGFDDDEVIAEHAATLRDLLRAFL